MLMYGLAYKNQKKDYDTKKIFCWKLTIVLRRVMIKPE